MKEKDIRKIAYDNGWELAESKESNGTHLLAFHRPFEGSHVRLHVWIRTQTVGVFQKHIVRRKNFFYKKNLTDSGLVYVLTRFEEFIDGVRNE